MQKKKTLEEYQVIYESLHEEISKQLEPGEEMVHCIDDKSFGGAFYRPNWAVTNYSRMFSLWKQQWLTINKRNNDYWSKHSCANTYVHRIVANYFCDKAIVKKYGEENVEVHHINGYDPEKSNKENNSAQFLCYVPKRPNIHGEITQIQRGTYEIPEETDSLTRFAMVNFPNAYANDRAGISLSVNEENEDELHMRLSFDGTVKSKDELEELLKRYPGTDIKKLLKQCPEFSGWIEIEENTDKEKLSENNEETGPEVVIVE